MNDDKPRVAVTKYRTVQVSEDSWIYKADQTRIFQAHETIADIVAWAEHKGNTHWRDLVFSPVYTPDPPDTTETPDGGLPDES